MIKKVTIKTVGIRDHKTVNGVDVPFTYKSGKNAGQPFVMVSIQTEEDGDTYFSTPAGEKDKARTVEVGQKLLLNFTETEGDNGKVFHNFNFPTKAQLAQFAVENA